MKRRGIKCELRKVDFMITVNSKESYLGKDIRKWCEDEQENIIALEVKWKYFSENTEYKPVDNVYYFVNRVDASESLSKCGSFAEQGSYLKRDLKKSPRRR